MAQHLAGLGKIDTEIADAMGIAESTFHKWKKDHPELKKAIKKGKVDPDDQVEKSLFERANGYSHAEDEIFQYKGVAVIVPTIKHYPPDVAACIFWLKNRRPKIWREKQEIQHTFDDSAKLLAESIDKI